MTCEEFELELPFQLSAHAALHVASCSRCQLSSRALKLALAPAPSAHKKIRAVVPLVLMAAVAAFFVMQPAQPTATPNMAAVEVPAPQVAAQASPAFDLLDDEVFSEVSWVIEDEDDNGDEDAVTGFENDFEI
jgi:hypothetical protein